MSRTEPGNSLIDVNSTALITRGFSAIALDPNLRDPRVQDWEPDAGEGSHVNLVWRIALSQRTSNIQQTQNFNSSMPLYLYAVRRTLCPPANSPAWRRGRTIDGLRQYRQVPKQWVRLVQRLTVELERRFITESGSSSSITRQLDQRDGHDLGSQQLPTGAVAETDVDTLNRFLNYKRDTTASSGGSHGRHPRTHQLRWNFIADLPFGG